VSSTTWAWLVLLFPLLGSIVVALGYRTLPDRAAGAIGTLAVGLAFVCGVIALVNLLGDSPDARHHASSLWDYASAAGLDIKLGIYVDPLSIFMVLIVTGVSTLIHLYSFGYMQSDEGYHRFFSYLNFFVFSMLLLVLAGNFVLLIVGWAFVGFASYALISFWYRRATAARAGMKAFVINVVGDIGLVLAAFLIFQQLGTFDYGEVFAKAPTVFHTNQWTVVAICLLLLLGAFAKSARRVTRTTGCLFFTTSATGQLLFQQCPRMVKQAAAKQPPRKQVALFDAMSSNCQCILNPWPTSIPSLQPGQVIQFSRPDGKTSSCCAPLPCRWSSCSTPELLPSPAVFSVSTFFLSSRDS